MRLYQFAATGVLALFLGLTTWAEAEVPAQSALAHHDRLVLTNLEVAEAAVGGLVLAVLVIFILYRLYRRHKDGSDQDEGFAFNPYLEGDHLLPFGSRRSDWL